MANYYERLGVRFRKPQITYVQKEMNEEELVADQKRFSIELVSQLKKGLREIIYVDETTFNLWQSPA